MSETCRKKYPNDKVKRKDLVFTARMLRVVKTPTRSLIVDRVDKN